MSKIKNIQEVPSQKWVYDPVCDAPHSYLGNKIVNHNCILWIDEVEKSLSGTKSSSHSDGGTLSRVFGTLLTAMQDGMEGVTVLATANNINMLPPEFIRRFNEVFFVDLPGPDERWDIFAIHLSKRGRDISAYNEQKQMILEKSDGFTGAEIEKAIKDAIAATFYDDKKEVGYQQILNALSDTKPISKIMKDSVNSIREKARNNYRFASSYAEESSLKRSVKTSKGKALDLNEALDDFDEITTSKQKQKALKTKKKSLSRFSKAAGEG